MLESDTELFEHQRMQRQEQIDHNLFLDGETDAAMGESPQSSDRTYLDGYLTRLRSLILEMLESGRRLQIRWADPPAFAFGYMDGPGDCIDGESNPF